MENIEIFNVYAGRIFARLYASFPIAQQIKHVETVNPPGQPPIAMEGEDWKRRREITSQTALWLADTGYLITRGSDPVGFVLSPKALEALNAVIPVLSPKEQTQTLGEQLTEATKQVATEAKNKAIGEIVGQVIGSAIRSMAGPT
jgi:hypothetical protein